MRGTFRLGLTAAVILGSSALALAIAPAPAQAALACTITGTGGLQAGGESGTSTSYYGVRGYIEYHNPDLCGSDNTSGGTSLMWTMIDAPSLYYPTDPAYDEYAQSGYIDAGPYSPYAVGSTETILGFSQYSLACRQSGTCVGADQQTKYVSPAINFVAPNTYAFTSKFVTDDDKIHMYANGVYVDETSYDPITTWSSAWRGEAAGETLELESNVVGAVTAKEHISSLTWVDSGGAFHPFASLAANKTTTPTTRYYSSIYTDGSGNPAVETWTDPTS